MAIALRRLAILESGPLRTTDELLEWSKLRKWVIDNDLVEAYKEQHYFSCVDEITQNGYAPKNRRSIFSRFLTFLGIK